MAKFFGRNLIWLTIAFFPSLSQAQTSSGQLPASSSTSAPPLAQPNDIGATSPEAESTRTKLKDVLSNKKYEDNQTLTDAKLRVDDGSLSRYSLNATLGYNGPTLGDFSTADQPNPDNKLGPYAQKLLGSTMGKYRLDPNHSIAVGTGVALYHPFSGLDRTDLYNPFVRYDIASRFGEVQMRNSPELIYSTIPDYTRVGEIGGFEWYNALVRNIGTSRFSVELDSMFFYWAFTRDYVGTDGSNVQSWSFSTSPILKYTMSDRLILNAGATFSGWDPRQRSDSSIYLPYRPTGSVGVIYAYNRDIYFAPYLSLFPAQFAWSTTTVNFNVVFSLL